MGKYKVSFKRQASDGDRREYTIMVNADTLGSAEDKALRDISMPHAKAFLSANDIIKIEQLE